MAMAAMAIPFIFEALIVSVLIILPLSASSSIKNFPKDHEISSSSSPFPPNFLFGTASSSYQFEGAYLSDGKGLSNWDVYAHEPGQIMDGSNGDVAVDHYHRYLEDIELMSNLGVNSYRFSISWARILPKGRYGGINLAGINYYNNLINALLQKGIQPFVTITHFDMPHVLEKRYGGWLSPKSQKDFGYFADICFKHFGDRVRYWVTLNEPNIHATLGYRYGGFPPSRCSNTFGNCSHGNSEKEPFVAAHNQILSHATAVDIYRTTYQKKQGGIIGIVLHFIWFEPITNSIADKLATERAQDFFVNWFLDPILFGKYPVEMTRILGSTLPEFSSNEKEKLKKGLDFIGINHYTSRYIQDCISSVCEPGQGASKTEGFCLQREKKNGIPIGEPSDLYWVYDYPQGMERTVTFLKERYNNTPMIITENGYGEMNNPNLTIQDSVHDVKRVRYMTGYLDALMTAMRKGADVRGYFAWSLLDNFEWTFGYTVRFGLHHVDYPILERTPKLSSFWFKEFIAKYKSPRSQM